jgi:hypothetical protein
VSVRNRQEYGGRGSFVDVSARVLFGLCGAISLLIPLVVLTFIKSVNYRLLATILFVLTFVLMIALLSDANNQELVGATAAYAAVLVVFVGTTVGS